MSRRPGLLDLATRGGSASERARAWIELGQAEEARGVLVDGAIEAETAARLALLCGDFLVALHRLEAAPSASPALLARILGLLGRVDEALLVLGDSVRAEDSLTRAELHLLVDEPGPASVALREVVAPASGSTLGAALSALFEARTSLARGSLALAGGESSEAVIEFRRGRDRARVAGSETLAARSWARLGAAHGRSGNRWRALRSVTHALDLAIRPRVAPEVVPEIYFQAFAVYAAFGHADLAKATLAAGHHRVIQIASGIDERAYRETYLLENRDCQRLVAAWKGEISWGQDIARG